MALNINTSGLNDSLRRLASFFMQNKLGELSNQRYMDTISEQDRLMRERGAEADVRARGLKQYESKINLDEHIKKAFIDTAKSNDAFDYNVRAAQVARESGDEEKAKALYGRAYELAIPNLTAKMNALKGKVNEQDFLATMEAFGEDGVEKIMAEAGTNQRANAQLPIQKSQAATSAGNLALEKEKFGVEQGGGGKAGKQYIDLWSKPLNDAINFLEPVARGDNVFTMMYQQPAGYMSSKLSEIQMRLNNGEKLSKEDEKTITQSRDLKDMIKKYSGQRLPGQIQGPGSPADIALTKQTEAGLVRPTAQATPAAPMPAVDTTTPSPHTTGEKKTVVINGVSATYIWDGTKWLLSDSR